MHAAVHLVLRDADPSGIVIATRDNWTGKAISLPIADLSSMREIFDTSASGVYVLSGITDDGEEEPIVYIGEAEEIVARLSPSHAQLKSTSVVWQRVVVFVST